MYRIAIVATLLCTLCHADEYGKLIRVDLAMALPIATKAATETWEKLDNYVLVGASVVRGTDAIVGGPDKLLWEFQWKQKVPPQTEHLFVYVDVDSGETTTSVQLSVNTYLSKLVIPKVKFENVPISKAIDTVRELINRDRPADKQIKVLLLRGEDQAITLEFSEITADLMLRFVSASSGYSYKVHEDTVIFHPISLDAASAKDDTGIKDQD